MTRHPIPEWLKDHRGYADDSPKAIRTTDDNGVSIEGEFTAIEGLGCSVRKVSVAPAQPLPPDANLRERANQLSDALPSGLQFQEADTCAPSALLRSPSRRDGDRIEYEEAVLTPAGVTVQRFTRDQDQPREVADLPVTWEQFDAFVRAAKAAVEPSP